MRCWVLLLSSITSAATVYVPGEYSDIQSAINAVSPGDSILVTSGAYYETIDFLGKDIALISSPPGAIIDGSFGSGPVVSFQNNETSSALLSGFIIRKGYAPYGGGIFCSAASPTITDNVICDNDADSLGGGICCIESNAIITGNTVMDSYVDEGNGGGIGIYKGAPVVYGNLIEGNTADSHEQPFGANGGGIYASNCSPSIVGNTLLENHAAGFYPFSRGGGIHLYRSSGTITCNTIIGNIATYGGGIGLIQCNTVTISNFVIADNISSYSDGEGDAIYSYQCDDLSIQNCTITMNSSSGNSTIIVNGSTSVSLINTIIWNNLPAVPQITICNSVTLDIEYTDLEGGQGAIQKDPGCTVLWGPGMIDVDPVFVTGPLSSFHLLDGVSPCIDAGHPDTEYNDPEDPENPGMALWPSLGTVRNDMGAYGGQGSIYWTEPWTGITENVTSPDPIAISQFCFPNPFSTSLSVSFSLPEASLMTLSVYDLSGRLVDKLVGGSVPGGAHTETWSPSPDTPSGCYLIMLEACGERAVRRAVLLR